MITMSMVIISQEKESVKVDRQEQINEYTSKLLLQRITYNGVEGYFIPFSGYQQLRFIINDYITLQELIVVKDNRIVQLERYELMNFKLKTGLGISIGFNVGEIILAVSAGMLTYTLGIQGK